MSLFLNLAKVDYDGNELESQPEKKNKKINSRRTFKTVE